MQNAEDLREGALGVELANAALQLHRERTSNKHFKVELRIAESATAHGKRGELLQMLVNLLLDALDALPHSGKLHLRVAERGDKAIFTIADNEGGIPETVQQSMSQSFKGSKE